MQGEMTTFETRIDELERRSTASNAEISRLYNRLHQASSIEDDMKKELEAMDTKTMQLQRHIRRQSERRRELEHELHWKAKELNRAVSSVEYLRVHRSRMMVWLSCHIAYVWTGAQRRIGASFGGAYCATQRDRKNRTYAS